MITLDSILLDASSFVSSEFGFDVEQSKLKPYSPENWQEFCQTNNFDINSSGIYVPASYSAYVRTDSLFLTSNIFHEFYGHGLFVEHSQIGKRLTEIIQNNGDEKSFMFDEISPQEQTFGIAKHNIHNYEGFAVWLEALLCNETGNSKVWQLKRDRLPDDFVSLFEYFQDVEQRFSRFGLISQMGFPKHYDDDKVLGVVRKLYGSNFNNVDFVVIYGSQKPESDIDLCVVSSNPSTQYFNGWLDIAELNREDFQNRINNLDIALTDAMFSGRLIFGDGITFHQYKQTILEKPISQEMIEYNKRKSKLQKEYLSSYRDNDRTKKLCLSYINSFSQNAEQLILGNKPLTLKTLQQLYKC
ncbi:nucleotidyltransferase domain-containing protein [Candidatus Woesearchaeota archaeon]|nr:nucleotidyltransferase domain-containing protein [Candidatus Woesearchaeota archaeon]